MPFLAMVLGWYCCLKLLFKVFEYSLREHVGLVQIEAGVGECVFECVSMCVLVCFYC